MKNYQTFEITYKGDFIEVIAAISKKSAEEYVRDEHKDEYKIVKQGNTIWKEKYLMKNFKVSRVF